MRSEDRDLLEGADAEAMSVRGAEGVSEVNKGALSPVSAGGNSARERSPSTVTEKFVEFER